MKQNVHLEDIPYCPDSCELFMRIRDLPGAVFLDSSFPHTRSGRYDILAAAPTDVQLPQLPERANEVQAKQFLNDLRLFHEEYFGDIKGVAPDIPFCGGILGYLGYEFGTSLHNMRTPSKSVAEAPSTRLGVYDWCIVQDHLLQRSALISQPRVRSAQRSDLLQRLRRPALAPASSFELANCFEPNLSQSQYRSAFERIQAYINAGDCYQVNLSQQFSAPFEGDPWEAYRILRAVAAAPFSAFMDSDDGNAVLCLSPERFISLYGQHVETSPIKGTRPRYTDPKADRIAIEALRNSSKDRAENLMIVDLLRNDLGRNCVPGSIHVDRLFEIQSFPTVHHLVSTISGELDATCSAFDLLRDSFPGGSITGAPKRRAMEIIAELEPHSRDIYCGSVFYVSADGRMDSNIAIRTLQQRDDQMYCWGGGGIVADSQWQQEYQETYDKVGKLLSALEQAALR
ncbi:MAG: para-aminobenzoate synthetase component 1 [Bacteroidia bacterium]|jgi:para-aminobenzoate synthetase component 1